MVTVSTKAWRAEGSRMFIEPKKAVSVDELLHGVIVQSGNDAAHRARRNHRRIGRGVCRAHESSEAARLGMKNTHFANATGLPAPQQVSTANDLALLATAIIRDFPEYYPLYSIKEYRYNNITQPNRNRLLWTDPYVDGMKTGNTDAAGYCLIASAKRGPRRLLSVVLGAGSDAARASESQKLLNYGFQFYDTVQLYQNGQTVSALRVWKGAERDCRRGLRRRPVRDAAEGPGAEAQADDGSGRAADRAGHAAASAWAWCKCHARRQAGRRISACWRSTTCRRRASSGAPGTPSGCGSNDVAIAIYPRQRHA